MIRYALVGVLALVSGAAFAQSPPKAVPQNPVQVRLSLAPVVKMAQPAVVNVYVSRVETAPRNPLFDDPIFRRFFGGEGIYADELMIGMIFDDVVYFKTDEVTRKAFAAAKTKPFSFYKGKELVVTTWFALPDRLHDDPEELAAWARAAHRVAIASPAAKKKARKAMKPARLSKKR